MKTEDMVFILVSAFVLLIWGIQVGAGWEITGAAFNKAVYGVHFA